MASPRCEKCRLITSEFTFNEEDRHSAIVHHNVEDLERSAAEGCDLCRLIRHSAVHDPLYNRAVTVSISLHHCRWLLREPYISIRLPHSTARGREGPTIRVLESRSDNLGEFGDEGVFSYRRAIRFAPNKVTKDLELLKNQAIRPWIERCRESHYRCYHPVTPPLLPTRVIDVGHGGRNPRLYIRDLEDEKCGRFVTLSYCWGSGNSSARTTQANVDARRDEIVFDELPRTIQDAILVTRSLGERFLWVNAICIIQPEDKDNTDWKFEAPEMSRYYQDSFCTIAAARAADSAEGFLTERLQQRYPVGNCVLDTCNDPRRPGILCRAVLTTEPLPSWHHSVDRSPLTERGWVLQERLMSRRILFWTKHALFWSCPEMLASEFNHKGSEFEHSASKPVPVNFDKMLAGNDDHWSLSTTWQLLVENYSTMEFTFESDRLVALMGISSRLQERFKDHFVFGLWRKYLLQGLCWQRSSRLKDRADSNIAPSWSWIASKGEVKFPLKNAESITWLLEIVDVDDDLDTLSFDRTQSECKLKVKGLLQNISFEGQVFKFDERKALGTEDALSTLLDRVDKVGDSSPITCLFLASYVHSWDPDIKLLSYMMLEIVDKHDQKYQRIGFGITEYDSIDLFNVEKYTEEKRIVIELI